MVQYNPKYTIRVTKTTRFRLPVPILSFVPPVPFHNRTEIVLPRPSLCTDFVPCTDRLSVYTANVPQPDDLVYTQKPSKRRACKHHHNPYECMTNWEPRLKCAIRALKTVRVHRCTRYVPTPHIVIYAMYKVYDLNIMRKVEIQSTLSELQLLRIVPYRRKQSTFFGVAYV